MHNFSLIPRVVFAVGRNGPAGTQLLGTAFCLNKKGHFATASHVVGTDDTNLVIAYKEMTDLSVFQDTADNTVKTFPVKTSASDPFHDLVVLKTDLVDVTSNIVIESADLAPPGTAISSFGFPHADHGRMVLTQQDTSVGARVFIEAGGIKSKHIILNTQARPGQSGSPVFRQSDGKLVAVLVGSYAPGGGGGISLGGIDPHTLHQTTHAVSAEYLKSMF